MQFRNVWTRNAILGLTVSVLMAPVSPPVAAALVSPQPDDTFLGQQWYLEAIHARDGWSTVTGSRDIIVAVVDSGVDITHQDLRENIWKNPGEIPGNGTDDDQDGFVDDVHGWNFVASGPDLQPQTSAGGPEEAFVHGTAVASMIAAKGNNGIGIAGVAWHARLMPLVVLDEDGYGRNEDVVRAIRFAVAHGADIINLSLVGYEYDAVFAEAIRDATSRGILIVSAAGNGETETGIDLDETPGYPACDEGEDQLGKITVTAIDRNGRKMPRANYGSCVDVSAPGTAIFAARPTRDVRDASVPAAGYIGSLSGTSIAAPLVSGLAVLLKAAHPAWRGAEIAARIQETADSVDAENPAYRGMLGRGRVNVGRALVEDVRTASYGPLMLETSVTSTAPEVRVVTAAGTEVRRFVVGNPGDRRRIHATFLRWQQKLEPDIAVTVDGDPAGAYRIYRPDGLLIAAGSLSPKSDSRLVNAFQRPKSQVTFSRGWIRTDIWPH